MVQSFKGQSTEILIKMYHPFSPFIKPFVNTTLLTYDGGPLVDFEFEWGAPEKKQKP